MYVLLKRLMRISLNVESRIQLANQQWKPSTETKRDYIEICFCSNDSPCHTCSRHRRHKKILNFSFCLSNFQAWLHMTRSNFWSQISPYKKRLQKYTAPICGDYSKRNSHVYMTHSQKSQIQSVGTWLFHAQPVMQPNVAKQYTKFLNS